MGDKPIPKRGTYTLIIFLPVERRVKVGKLGAFWLRKGYYLYTGSALGKGALSLEGRVARHLQRSKRTRWHIDYLLSLDDILVKAVVTAETESRMECEINRYLKESMGAEVPILGFGSSDCRGGCGSHLLFVGEEGDPSYTVTQLYAEKTGRVPTLKKLQ